jgi:hypothetical protein
LTSTKKRLRCQLHCLLGRYTPKTWFRQWNKDLRAKISLRSRLRELLSRRRRRSGRQGVPSRYLAGTWVRVLDEVRIRDTLDGNNKLCGLLWAKQQWPYCGTTHRVLKPVRRMLDDKSTMRPISRTVLLDTVLCGGTTGLEGCGRECPMMFRDEWLEQVPSPHKETVPPSPTGSYATVRSAGEIKQTLDSNGSYRGLLFMPEMYERCGLRYPVLRRIRRVWGPGVYMPVAEPVCLLEGLHCTGAVLGEDGPCDRGCRLLWHEDWLALER